ncbi:GW dipeptide domain-containing protein [Lacticaseibacillus baoqingensis]|uniref:GW dipeptide domain-containing protein n=1 Tax=Lacticaseibacillus baoqingensis TaxID=2486013 RepID=A0ABW4E6E0_9LACO|nr:GW dipeptide domain-containing protein [Lacticaseibacillus baoqingensis]
MNKKTAQRSVWGVVGLFSALILANQMNTGTLYPDASTDAAVSTAAATSTASSQTTANSQIKVTNDQVKAAATVAEAAFSLTNQHSNQGVETVTDHSMGTVISDDALKAMTNESGSTSKEHILRMPAGLDEVTAAKWLVVAKKNAEADYQKTGRSQQIIQVAATASTLTFAIGNTSVPSVDAVDVASYQNWMGQAQYNQLKALGVKTVIVKVSESTNYANEYAASQIKYAQNAGLKVAVYHFARFGNAATAAAEANKTAATMRSLGLPKSTLVFADMEASETDTNNVGANLNQYWATLNAAGYTNHGVYTGGLFGSTYANATSGTVGAAKTWFAQYPYTPSKNDLWNTQYGAWQFSSTAYLPGHAGNSLDTSVDYQGLFTSAAKAYDTIKSTKAVNLPGTIDQNSRADGFYSAPYNTNAATATANSNAKAFNGQTVQVLQSATTSRSAAAGNTFYQVRFVNGKTYWTDSRAVKLGSFYGISNRHTVNYTARIKQSGRHDGLYPGGPYKTSLANIYQNSNAPAYDNQIVPVTAEATTATGTYCQIKLNSGQVEWIDKHGLTTDIYDKVTSKKTVALVGKINQSGREDGLYSAPYCTNAATITPNHNALGYNERAVAIIAEATTDRSGSDGNTYYQVRFTNGQTNWINARGVALVTLNQVTSKKTVNMAGTIAQSGRADGLYSAPYYTDVLTITENHNAQAFNGQKVQVVAEATTNRSAAAGNTFYQVKFSNGRLLWLDSRGVKTMGLEAVTNTKTVSYDAKITENGRRDGLYAHPYNSDADSIFSNTDALAYNGRGVKVTAEGTTSQGTYAKVTLPDKTTKWIDVKALTKITYNQVTSTKTVALTGKINQTGRADGLYSAPYYTDALSVLENHNAAGFNGQTVKVLKQAITNRSAAAGNKFYEIQLASGKTYWIDSRGVALSN